MERNLQVFVHDDIDVLFNNTTMPIAFRQNSEVYIMQEDRVVFLGAREQAIHFYNRCQKGGVDYNRELKPFWPNLQYFTTKKPSN